MKTPSSMYGRIKQYVPMLEWASVYNSNTFTSDAVAAIIVTIMLIPQSLAYALLAGLPAEMGLYASILPLVAYAIWDIAGLGGWTRCGCLTHDRCGDWKSWPYITH